MFGAPPPGFMQNLNRKYALMARDVASRELQAQSGANLANARALGIGADADFQRARTAAINEGVADNRALFGERLEGAQTDIAGRQATTAQTQAQTDATRFGLSELRRVQAAQNRGMPRTTMIYDPTLDPEGRLEADRFWREGRVGARPGFAKGTARVPGKGSGKVDTVPAKLAPGEAVLNKAAADMTGRGLIAALNKLGAQKMGMA